MELEKTDHGVITAALIALIDLVRIDWFCNHTGMSRRVVLGILPVLLFFVGCSRWRQAPRLPVAGSIVLDELVVYSDFELADDHPLLVELNSLRDEITLRLNLPKSQRPVHVYLFKTPRRYRQFIDRYYPDFPDRRAFFVETESRLSVYAYWGERIAEDLRHEVAHGYLHAAIPNLPLWLDEGLAEYFEVDRGQRGLNRAHLDQLIDDMEAESWQPELPRLEKLAAISDMNQADYAESWAWVYFLLETTPHRRELLHRYLAELRELRVARPLSEILAGQPGGGDQLLATHLRAIALGARLP